MEPLLAIATFPAVLVAGLAVRLALAPLTLVILAAPLALVVAGTRACRPFLPGRSATGGAALAAR